MYMAAAISPALSSFVGTGFISAVEGCVVPGGVVSATMMPIPASWMLAPVTSRMLTPVSMLPSVVAAVVPVVAWPVRQEVGRAVGRLVNFCIQGKVW